MAAKKLKVFSNDREIQKRKDEINRTQKLISDLLEYYREQQITLSDDEVNALIKGNFSLSTIERLADERHGSAPQKKRRELMQDFINDVLMHHHVFTTAYITLSTSVFVKSGKVKIKSGTFEAIEEQYTQYLTDEKSIQLYHRHNDLISALNALKDDINAHTGGNANTSYLVRWDANGNAYRPDPINYGL